MALIQSKVETREPLERATHCRRGFARPKTDCSAAAQGRREKQIRWPGVARRAESWPICLGRGHSASRRARLRASRYSEQIKGREGRRVGRCEPRANFARCVRSKVACAVSSRNFSSAKIKSRFDPRRPQIARRIRQYTSTSINQSIKGAVSVRRRGRENRTASSARLAAAESSAASLSRVRTCRDGRAEFEPT